MLGNPRRWLVLVAGDDARQVWCDWSDHLIGHGQDAFGLLAPSMITAKWGSSQGLCPTDIGARCQAAPFRNLSKARETLLPPWCVCGRMPAGAADDSGSGAAHQPIADHLLFGSVTTSPFVVAAPYVELPFARVYKKRKISCEAWNAIDRCT